MVEANDQATQSGPDVPPWRYVFFGHVYPVHEYLDMPNPFSIDMKHSAVPLEGRLTVSLQRMQVVSIVEIKEEFADIYTLRNVVEDMTSIITDCANFLAGKAFEIQLVSVHDVRRNRSMVFLTGAPAVATHGTGHADISTLMDVAWSSPDFRRALADFRNAIRYPGQTGFHCERIVEAMAHYFGPMSSTTNIRRTRGLLRSALNISKATDNAIVRAGASPRHGGGPWVSNEQRGKLLEWAREMLGRFVQVHREKHSGAAPTTRTPL
jgi:hypothetical protein